MRKIAVGALAMGLFGAGCASTPRIPVLFTSGTASIVTFRYIGELEAKLCENTGRDVADPRECKSWSSVFNTDKRLKLPMGNYRVMTRWSNGRTCIQGLVVEPWEDRRTIEEVLLPCRR
ncbi:MAG: hypothetical protein ACFBQW_01215 [Sphingomonadaceae bacterium]